jgi:hypothetical protein
MSTGNLRYEKKNEDELYEVLGDRDTPELYARKFKVDTTHDIPYMGANSIDGATVYIDRVGYRDCMDGITYVRGMSPSQIVRSWIEHEHSEWAIEFGENPSQTYPSSHGYATAKEHKFVKMLPVDPDRYERCIKSALERAMDRFIAGGTKCNPPYDLWCGPVLDDPDKKDKEVIRILQAKGIKDAFKKSKGEVKYGLGPNKCKDCAMFGDRDIVPHLRKCDVVNGLVRDEYWCEHWVARKKGNGHG